MNVLTSDTALVLLVLYYRAVWRAVGRDPPGRIVVPHYEPPKGQSPASMRYLIRMGYDDRCFAAAVLALAIKGALRIEQRSKGLFGRRSEYTLHRTEPKSAEALSEDEWTLREKLFASATSIELDDKNHVAIGGARRSHSAFLRKRLMPSFFRINGGWHVLGIALSLLLGAGIVLLGPTVGGYAPEWWFLTPTGWIAIAAAVFLFDLFQQTKLGLTNGTGRPLGDDFVNYWSAAKLASLQRASEVYDWMAFHRFQESVAGGPLDFYHYSYPPVLLLLTLPLAALDLAATGEHDGILERGAPAQPRRDSVDLDPASLPADDRLARRGVADPAGDRATVLHERHGDAPFRDSGHELPRSVERIDDPHAFPRQPGAIVGGLLR